MTAPVIATLAKPSASGSAAAAREPNTASRISEHDREADRLGALEVLLGEVLHAGPERLLAHEVRLDADARARCRARRGGRRPCWRARSAVAVDRQRHDRDRRRRRARAWRPPRRRGSARRGEARRRCRPTRSISRRTSAASAPRGVRARRRGTRAARPRSASRFALHDLRPRARHLEAAARQVLGLPGGERERREQHDDPGAEHEPAAPLEEAREPVHRCLHRLDGLPETRRGLYVTTVTGRRAGGGAVATPSSNAACWSQSGSEMSWMPKPSPSENRIEATASGSAWSRTTPSRSFCAASPASCSRQRR